MIAQFDTVRVLGIWFTTFPSLVNLKIRRDGVQWQQFSLTSEGTGDSNFVSSLSENKNFLAIT
jgi:hypothetical protein